MQQDGLDAGSSSPRRFRTIGLALIAGVAGGLVAPLLYPSVARNARPVTRKALKAGMAAFERGREIAAELGEQAGDLLAEARAEYDDERKPLAAGAAAGNKEVVSLRGSGRDAAGS
jgi:H+/Cl- antiporter ClcA